jgi:malate permease and related proteins
MMGMASLITLAVSLLLGVGLQRVKNIPDNAHSTLGTLILYVPLPAVCLLTLPDLEWNLSLLGVGAVTWIIFFGALFLFPWLGRKYHWDKELVACLILTAGFCNSAFIGFPVIDALYGKEALKHAIFLDQAGSFLIVSTFGIWLAITYSSGKMRKRILFRKIILFPPFISFIVAILIGLMGLRPEGALREVLERLASLLTPMALISVGLQLHWNDIRAQLRFLTLGLTFKLILAPLGIFLIYYALNTPKDILNIVVMESAMAPMITSSILAASHNLRPKLAGMMVGVGVPLSFFTLGLWYYFLKLV